MSARIKMTSPKGVAVWPWLNEPDKRFDERGTYTVTLRVGDGAEDFIRKLNDIYNDGYARQLSEQKKAKLKEGPMPWSAYMDDQGEPTGLTEFKFKNNAAYKYEGKMIENRIQIIDSKRNPIVANVGGGSTLRVGFEPYVWFVPSMGVGMSLRLKIVQVLDLVEFGGGNSASEFGFEEEEGFVGIVKSEETPEEPANDFDF